MDQQTAELILDQVKTYSMKTFDDLKDKRYIVAVALEYGDECEVVSHIYGKCDSGSRKIIIESLIRDLIRHI
jgi:hypothetical protein